MPSETVSIFLAVLAVAAIFGYLFFRRKPELRDSTGAPIQQLELKLIGNELTPAEVRLELNKPARLLLHRYDTDPADEIFEIDELEIYELLPAATTTIIAFLPTKPGKFKLVLAGEKEVGVMIVE